MIDLHIHSTFSDGTLTPEEIILEAKNLGLTAISITDHDSIAGIKSCQNTGLIHGIDVIPGVELSADYNQMEVHILGYGFNPSDNDFNNTLKQLADKRMSRNSTILQKLNQLGLIVTLADLIPEGDVQPVFTRAHIAQALTHKGYVKYPQEAFDRYLGVGRPAYVAKDHLHVEECINLIHSAGGYAILAHPTLYKMNKVRMNNMIIHLIQMGLDGVECIYPSYTPKQIKDFLQFCEKFNLISTGGTDFHGKNKPRIQLGIGYGALDVPDSFLFNLRSNRISV